MKTTLPWTKEENVWNTGNPLGCLSVLICPRIKVNGQLKPVQRGLFMALGMAVWVSPPSKEARPAEGLAEDRRNAGRVAEGSCKRQVWPREQLQSRAVSAVLAPYFVTTVCTEQVFFCLSCLFPFLCDWLCIIVKFFQFRIHVLKAPSVSKNEYHSRTLPPLLRRGLSVFLVVHWIAESH